MCETDAYGGNGIFYEIDVAYTENDFIHMNYEMYDFVYDVFNEYDATQCAIDVVESGECFSAKLLECTYIVDENGDQIFTSTNVIHEWTTSDFNFDDDDF